MVPVPPVQMPNMRGRALSRVKISLFFIIIIIGLPSPHNDPAQLS